eukprot:GILK01009022.1.p1 GENE.GILK01009022.1~~GILK01009022.1.p1  ORF type:complete len:1357 (-),score=314.26 GILK01009022.1:31-4065(-)
MAESNRERTFSADLLDQYEVICKKASDAKKTCRAFVSFYTERATVEKDTAQALMKSYRGQVGPSCDKEQSTFRVASQSILNSTARIAELHMKFSTMITEEIVAPLHSLRVSLSNGKKKYMADADRYNKQLEKFRANRNRAQTRFEKALREKSVAYAALEDLTRGTGVRVDQLLQGQTPANLPTHVTRALSRLQACEREEQQATKEAQDANRELQAASIHHKQGFEDICNLFQQSEEKRLKVLRLLIEKATEAEQRLYIESSQLAVEMAMGVSAFSPHTDIQEFIDTHSHGIVRTNSMVSKPTASSSASAGGGSVSQASPSVSSSSLPASPMPSHSLLHTPKTTTMPSPQPTATTLETAQHKFDGTAHQQKNGTIASDLSAFLGPAAKTVVASSPTASKSMKAEETVATGSQHEKGSEQGSEQGPATQDFSKLTWFASDLPESITSAATSSLESWSLFEKQLKILTYESYLLNVPFAAQINQVVRVRMQITGKLNGFLNEVFSLVDETGNQLPPSTVPELQRRVQCLKSSFNKVMEEESAPLLIEYRIRQLFVIRSVLSWTLSPSSYVNQTGTDSLAIVEERLKSLFPKFDSWLNKYTTSPSTELWKQSADILDDLEIYFRDHPRYLFPTNLLVYQQLLPVCFDEHEKTKLHLHFHVFQQALISYAAKIGISPSHYAALLTRLYADRYVLPAVTNGQTDLESTIETVNQLMAPARATAASSFASPAASSNRNVTVPVALILWCLDPLVSMCTKRLSNYRQWFGLEPAAIIPYLSLFSSLPTVLPADMTTSLPSLPKLLALSATEHYKRLTQSVERPMDVEELTALCGVIQQEIETENEHFLPLWAQHVTLKRSNMSSTSRQPEEKSETVKDETVLLDEEMESNRDLHMFSITLLQLLRGDLANTIQDVTALDSKITALAKAIASCELTLPEGIELEPSPSSLLAPLLHEWMADRFKNINDCAQRAAHMEQWTAAGDDVGYTHSVVDLCSLLFQVLEAFDGLLGDFTGIPWKEAFADCLARVAKIYIDTIVDNLDDLKSLIPPYGPLDFSSASKPSSWKILKKINKSTKKLVGGNRNQPQDDEESELKLEKLDRLCLRLGNLHFFHLQLCVLQQRLGKSDNKRRYTRKSLVKKAIDPTRLAADAIPQWLLEVKGLLTKKAEFIAEYISLKVVYGDLREVFMDRLYLPNVRDYPLKLLLLEDCVSLMDSLWQNVPDAYFPLVLQNLFAAMTAMWERVLLDGGPKRIFSPDDSDVFDEDLSALKNFFLCKQANGEVNGLSEAQVEYGCAPLESLAQMMSMGSTDLIGLYQLPSTSAPDRDRIPRILIHRSDKDQEGKRFLYSLKKSMR